MIYSFLGWLLLIYPNFKESTAFIIGGLIMLGILILVSRWGYRFIDE